MSAIVIVLFLYGTCPAEMNNSGNASSKDKKRIIVFIHGFKGDSTETWTNKKTKAVWPILIRKDSELKGFDIDTYSYRTSCEVDGLNVEELSSQFSEYLKQETKKYDEIYIVAHSMGGIISLRAISSIEPRFPQELSKIKGLFLMGVPFKGTNIFESYFGGIFRAFCPSRQLPDLKPDISYLYALENDWTRIGHIKYPQIYAAYEKRATLKHIIVSRDSLFSPLADTAYPVDKDHINIVKPADRNDSVYKWVKDKIIDIQGKVLKEEKEEVKKNVANSSREAYLMRPVLELASATSENIGVKMRDDSHGFYIPLIARNLGNSTATNVRISHVFFNYPPEFEDEKETNVFDMLPKTKTIFEIIKYIRTERLLASINFLHYQNIITILQWRSDNTLHAGMVFQQALWWRLFYNPLGKSELIPVKSRYYTWNISSDTEAFHVGFSNFIEDETITKAYDLEEYMFEHKGHKGR